MFFLLFYFIIIQLYNTSCPENKIYAVKKKESLRVLLHVHVHVRESAGNVATVYQGDGEKNKLNKDN